MNVKEKAILLANVGTSDIEIYLDGYGYIPVWERQQPNQARDFQELETKTIQTWNNRIQLITDQVCRELRVEIDDSRKSPKLPFQFIDLTQKLQEAYENKPDTWRSRIFASRLLGIIQQAKEKFELDKIILFVSKQNPLFESDTVYLFDILEKWFKDNYSITLKPEYIPKNIKLNSDQDVLFEYYYNVFQSLELDTTIILSVKGGTPVMQTALRTQSNLASLERPILLVDTELYINRVISGQPSPAFFTSYLKYTKIQKYQVVHQLLERWDFDGAMKILQDWKEYIKKLTDQGISDDDIKKTQDLLQVLVKALDIGIAYFNLDISGNYSFKIKPKDNLDKLLETKNSYDGVLNLYTQCRIYWEVNQVANFLSRMGSFCEEVLHKIIIQLNALKFFDKEYNENDWFLDKRKFKSQQDQKLWKSFCDLQNQNNNRSFTNHDFSSKPRYKLSNRFIKWEFVDTLIDFRGDYEEIEAWGKITESLDKLDYWVGQRNKLIHSAEGVSKTNMSKLLQADKQNDNEDAINACKRDEILAEMTTIIFEMRKLLNFQESEFVGQEKKYYIYSDIKDWITEKLKKEG